MDKRLVGVECYTDKYFFAKLLANDAIIDKLSNNTQVINKLTASDNFKIGIVDIDKDAFAMNEKLEAFKQIFKGEFHKILKHTSQAKFLFIVGPRQLEYFLVEFLKLNHKTVENFGFTDFNDFLKESKSRNPLAFPKILKLLKFILENHNNFPNHILKIKNQLNYILDKKYNFNQLEFTNV